MSFGWSAGDIYQLIVACHTLVSNCTLGPTSALQIVHGLAVEIQELERLLQQLQDLVQDGGETSCIDLRGIEDTLRDCRTHMQKYNNLQQAYDNHHRNNTDPAVAGERRPSTTSTTGGRTREFLISGRNAARVGGELVRHATWGNSQISALQDRVSRHKQSLTLYLTVLERERSIRMGKRLQSVERMIHEIHAEAMPLTRTYPLQRVGSIPSSGLGISDGSSPDSDRYHIMLEAVERQREYAMLQRALAETGNDREWETICDQLDRFHRRVLNVIERKTNSSAQHGCRSEHGSQSENDIELNRTLLNMSRGSLMSPSNENQAYRRRRHAAFETPLERISDEIETETDRQSSHVSVSGTEEVADGSGSQIHRTLSTVTLPSYPPSVFSNFTSTSTAATEDTAVPTTNATHMEIPGSHNKPSYMASPTQPLSASPSTVNSLSIPLSTSPGSIHSYSTPISPGFAPRRSSPNARDSISSFASTAPSVVSMENGNVPLRSRSYSNGNGSSFPPSPGMRLRRDTDDSGHHLSCVWKTIPLNGGVKISWQGHSTSVRCVLSMGYKGDGRMYAIRATDPTNPDDKLPILRLSSAERPTIPHIEPPGDRHRSHEAGVIYFIKAPKTKYGEHPKYYIEDRSDLIYLQSLIFGKNLLLSMLVQKISSVNGKESDRQYLRIWEETDGEGHDGDISILYFASARERPRYIEVHRNNIDPGFERNHRSLVLELQLLQSGQYLRITFSSASDLQLFTETLFKHERPPALQVPRVSSLFADGSAALPWGSP
ncbi:hypothetical protein H109_08028 [Trichophyton interdigitale MR816]|uniref:Uncharacterized protein n=1 Tax=Trichophyton interdigitale (strain MR816) TaxID=1215338 RepID=A0A059IWU2_TRIIM|nr:hypothetical protein H101_00261 [Trichophyton interdigitale H6]KDB20004.1 hypothetical protein H109_08028 [Trichophyton interdigitale MR816]